MPGSFAVKLPVDLDAVAIHPSIPGSGFPAQRLQVGYSSGSQTLTGEDPDFDLRLIEPTSMGGRVVNGKPIPDLAAELGAVEVRQGLLVVDVQVIHHQMDGLGLRICKGQLGQDLSEFKPRTIGCGKGEMAACLRFYSTENICRTAALVFVIASRFASRPGGGEGTDLGMQRNRLLIQTHHRLLWIVWPFIRLQGVLHIGNVVFIEVGYAPHFFPATA